MRAKRAAAIARRQYALTGVSIFPDLGEADAAVDAPSPLPKDAAAGPLAPLRLAEPFEALRDASDRVLADSGARPKIFLANLGRPADFTARATFAKNFFEAGGIEAVDGDGIDVPALAAAFKAAGTRIACLCSSDRVYEQQAVAAARALAAADARYIYLAGRPGQHEADLKAAGVQSFVYEGCDAVATLNEACAILGVRIG